MVKQFLVNRNNPFYTWAMNECSLNVKLYNYTWHILEAAEAQTFKGLEDYKDILDGEISPIHLVSRMIDLNESDFTNLSTKYEASLTVFYCCYNFQNGKKKDFKEVNTCHFNFRDIEILSDGTVQLADSIILPIKPEIDWIDEIRIERNGDDIFIEVEYEKLHSELDALEWFVSMLYAQTDKGMTEDEIIRSEELIARAQAMIDDIQKGASDGKE